LSIYLIPSNTTLKAAGLDYTLHLPGKLFYIKKKETENALQRTILQSLLLPLFLPKIVMIVP